MRALLLLVVGAALCASSASFATNVLEQQFQLVGSGTLKLDQPVQKNQSVQLKATLTPSDGATTPSLLLHSGGHFAIAASLAVSSLVCYSDTIFRDGFDGTGF